jgi:hypothetical protein
MKEASRSDGDAVNLKISYDKFPRFFTGKRPAVESKQATAVA